MKKLLSFLGTVAISGTGLTTLVSCSAKVSNNEENNNDQDILLAISKEVKALLNDNLFKNYIDSDDDVNLQIIYDKVDNINDSYELDNTKPDDQKILNYLSDVVTKTITEVNQIIKKEYSNYYQNSDPIEYNSNDLKATIKYVDLQSLIKDLDIDIPGIENTKMVGIELNLSYKVNLKELNKTDSLYKTSNITNNIDAATLLNNKIYLVLQAELDKFMTENTEIDLNKTAEFQKIYNSFDISSLSSISDALKNKFQNFIKNSDLQNYKIKFNSTEFLANPKSFFDNKDNFTTWASQNGGVKTGQLYPYIGHSMPYLFFGTGDSNNLENLTADTFVNKYLDNNIPGFKIEDGKFVTLWTFNLDLSFINLYGMNLSGLMSTGEEGNNQVFEGKITLSKEDLNQKLQNYGKIIVEFYKNYSAHLEQNKTSFKVSPEIFEKLKNSDDKSANFLIKTLKDSFINSDIAKTLEDINIFDISNYFGAGVYKLNDDGSIYLGYAGGWSMDFTFGSNQNIKYTSNVYFAEGSITINN
ncbi:hypothetical protein [Spiroplasma eriocheiris]|uniref:Lipoprotein n=1 Tax=Spiroplasma eriocheiris TaxID=315358 RepID=A0A0H3XK89_9MOLU|nr:hypothetical protein [Spiroplasma eriocheiris]AHF57851.1 hypothetical protein SPE_0729 [Spiroplasma eriocheiris CCTCC M 207170]AKM54296.1 hypothetical protein SERIO_v1c07330 [Spiroplasma eriocheiris]